jgi:hypothetical protein
VWTSLADSQDPIIIVVIVVVAVVVAVAVAVAVVIIIIIILTCAKVRTCGLHSLADPQDPREDSESRRRLR